ncbi:MAG: hypothetical protein QOJ04_6139, partial [Caballeronia sp.]|nr:hypothetical protein [Caballeronia sp.]
EHVRGVAAAAIDAERARPRAILLVAPLTDRALAAADPREDDDLAPRRHRRAVRPGGDGLAGDLVAHGQGQVHAARTHFELLAAAEIEKAFADMEVAVTDAGGRHLDEHFLTGRLRRRPVVALQGPVENGDVV